MKATILQGTVFDTLPTIAPGSVDCVVTSPPYWMLRSYLPKGHALKPMELGGEPTPAAFIDNLVRVFRLVREVLSDHGTVWLNCGDTYSSGDVQHEGACDIGDIATGDSQERGCPSQNLCDACRALGRNKVRKGRRHSAKQSPLPYAPSPEHKESVPDHPPTSDSLPRKRSRRSSSAKQGQPQTPSLVPELRRDSSCSAVSAESLRPPLADNLAGGILPASAYPLTQGSSSPVSPASEHTDPGLNESEGCIAGTASRNGQPFDCTPHTATASTSSYGTGGNGSPRDESGTGTCRTCSECGSLFEPSPTDVQPPHSIIRQSIPSGNLCLIPQRLAIALQDDGWLVRSVIVWHKPACMPASLAGWRWMRCRVKVGGRVRGVNHAGTQNGYNPSPPHPDNGIIGAECQWSDCPGCKKCEATGGYVLRRGSWRPTSSWEPILMLAKSPRYFADGEAVKTPAKDGSLARMLDGSQRETERDRGTREASVGSGERSRNGLRETFQPVMSANLRDVWTIPSEPLKEKHYAAFPTALVRNCLKAGTSARGYCPNPDCGAPWIRVIDSKASTDGRSGGSWAGAKQQISRGGPSRQGDFTDMESITLGWRPSCTCPPAEPRPGLVLDCFSGSGRTGIEANYLGLDFVGVELNPAYVEMSRRILRDEFPLFSAAAED